MTSPCSSMSVWLCWVLWALIWQSSEAIGPLCGKRLADTLDLICAERGFHIGKRNGRSIGSVYGKHTDMGSSSNSITNSNFHHRNSFISNKLNNFKDFQGSSDEQTKAAKALSFLKRRRYELVNFLANVDVIRPYNYTAHYLRRQNPEASWNGQDVRSKYDEDEDMLSPGGIMGSGVSKRRRRRQTQPRNAVDECCHRPCDIPTLFSYCAAADEPVQHWPEHVVRQFFGLTTPGPTTTQRPSHRRPPAQINRGVGRQRSQFFYVPIDNQATRSPLLVDRES